MEFDISVPYPRGERWARRYWTHWVIIDDDGIPTIGSSPADSAILLFLSNRELKQPFLAITVVEAKIHLY